MMLPGTATASTCAANCAPSPRTRRFAAADADGAASRWIASSAWSSAPTRAPASPSSRASCWRASSRRCCAAPSRSRPRTQVLRFGRLDDRRRAWRAPGRCKAPATDQPPVRPASGAGAEPGARVLARPDHGFARQGHPLEASTAHRRAHLAHPRGDRGRPEDGACADGARRRLRLRARSRMATTNPDRA